MKAYPMMPDPNEVREPRRVKILERRLPDGRVAIFLSPWPMPKPGDPTPPLKVGSEYELVPVDHPLLPWLTEPCEICEECGGAGGFHTAGTQPTGDNLPSSSWVSCRSCVNGLVPPEALVERVGRTMCVHFHSDHRNRGAACGSSKAGARRVLAALTEGDLG